MAHDPHENEVEPQTPMWLPALGIALFLLAGIWWATRPVPQAPPPAASVLGAASASAAASH